METRALCIAVFYAVGTGIGGIIGPQVFSRMIKTDSYQQVFLALGLGAVMMILGGLAEIAFGVRAERASLESIARPADGAGRGRPSARRRGRLSCDAGRTCARRRGFGCVLARVNREGWLQSE